MKLGPHVNRLIIHKISIDAVPPGGGVESALTFLSDKDRIIRTVRESRKWVEQALQAIRQASEPNPMKTWTDEEIAEEILKRIAVKKLGYRGKR